MAKIDLYDPKWVDLVFQNKNKEYGAYELRKGTGKRNVTALLILLAAALLIGGYLVWKIEADKRAAERAAYMEQLELSKLQEQAKKERKEEQKIEKPKVEQPKKEIPEVRKTEKFTAPVIKKDELVNEKNLVKQQDKLDNEAAKGIKDEAGTTNRLQESARAGVTANRDSVKHEKKETKPDLPPPPPPDKVFDVVEQQPSFAHGNVNAWLSQNIHYPPVAEENNIQGRVVVSFVVEKDGSISGAQVVKGVDPSLDKEALRVVKSMPKWNPGKQNGQAVRVKFNLPVTFKLQ